MRKLIFYDNTTVRLVSSSVGVNIPLKVLKAGLDAYAFCMQDDRCCISLSLYRSFSPRSKTSFQSLSSKLNPSRISLEFLCIEKEAIKDTTKIKETTKIE